MQAGEGRATRRKGRREEAQRPGRREGCCRAPVGIAGGKQAVSPSSPHSRQAASARSIQTQTASYCKRRGYQLPPPPPPPPPPEEPPPPKPLELPALGGL